jgi:Leucine-rich repeat (LRR) protein
LSTQLTSIIPDTRIASITGNSDYPNLSDVDTFSINEARVTFIPDFTLVARQFPKFKRLIINSSGLKYVERKQLAKIPQITKLDLARNVIELLPIDAFSDLVNLETLSVAANRIKVLPPKLLWNLPKLKEFFAWSNQIELIPRDFFKNNRELENLWISDSKVTRIEVDFTLLPNLELLNLNNNDCTSERFCSYCKDSFPYGRELSEVQQDINRNCA